jgi:hypothetical protein
MKQMVWSAATIWVSTRSTAVFVGVYKSPGLGTAGRKQLQPRWQLRKSRFSGIVTAERLSRLKSAFNTVFQKTRD